MKKLNLIVLFLPTYAIADNCHPPIDPHLPQYIIGYGSLIDEQSKKRTDPTAQAGFPVLVQGYARSWSVCGDLPGFNATFLAVSEDKHASFNGVIYQLTAPHYVQQYDEREAVYCRKEVSTETLSLYSGSLPKQKQIWIYSPTQPMHAHATQNCPMVQSYVDIFIRGCIQIEEQYKIPDFAQHCIQSTSGWSEHWVNDRIYPRRPYIHEPKASKIDALIKKTLPAYFKQIKIE